MPPEEQPRPVPVLVGVGQASERLEDPGYEALSPVDLTARALAAALEDAGLDPATLDVDVLACTRQFDESHPLGQAPLGRSDHFPRSVGARLGLTPTRTIYEISGGQSPQHLVTELAGDVAAGRARIAVVAGGEATSTTLDLASREWPDGERPDFTERVAATLGRDADDDRGAGLNGMVTRHQVDHHLTDPPTQYALFENARRARLGLSRAAHAAEMGALFAPFTEVAAANPHAAVPTTRSAADLMAVTDENRMIVDPYPKSVVSREKVNLAGAVVITSEEVAVDLGIPRERWVYLRGHADRHDRELLRRPDLGESPPSVQAVDDALAQAGVGLDDLATLDLYSCFPIAVSAVLHGVGAGRGLAPDDPRGLTLTGGLPFFGGPGNSYSLHAIVETVRRARATPGSWGLVGANGGMLSKYSAGVYSTEAGPWVEGHDARRQAELDAVPDVPVAVHADGWASIETFTVQHLRDRRRAIVVGRLDDGRRFLATGVDGDDSLVDLLLSDAGPGPLGARVFVRSFGYGNRVTLDEERMDELAPVPPVGFRDSYEFCSVRRDGHLLEVTIQRPETRNALTPEANQELADVFDAYLADRDLWVAIITGAGDKAFCSGNDLGYTASGKQIWMPKTGFAGLTARTSLTKPVIAALNGHALGGGFEIALACHLVVAEEQAQMGLPEVRVGLVAAAGGAVRLPRAVPPNVATEMVLTGRRMSAEEGLRWGVVNRVVPTGGALDGARALAAELMEGSPTSVRLTLSMIEQARRVPDPVAATEASSGVLDELLLARDTLEGVMAFVTKQKPTWRNQ